MGISRPYRNSSKSIPRIKKPSEKRKVVFYEYGTDYNEASGKTSLYVDVVNGNADLVDYVGFRFWPSEETHNIHKRTTVQLSDGTFARRFILKQHNVTNWSEKVTVAVCGRGGNRRTRRFRIKARHFRERPLKFFETHPLRDHYVTAPAFRFGIEFETSLGSETTLEDVVDAIKRYAGVSVIDRTLGYRRGTENYEKWQLVPDESTTCSRFDPNCNKFELVSRILSGENGMEECQKVLRALHKVGTATCNKSMGLHVHVDVSNTCLECRKNICLNFVKHESAMDSFMPPSRRNSDYCKSNRKAIKIKGDGQKHNAIAGCQSLEELCDLVNPGPAKKARYYKLNLQNLHPVRKSRKEPKPTIEFRQHSCTTNFEKVEAWVRFCTSLCRNSTERPPKLKHYEDAFESLFDTVIQDVRLKEFYRKRRNEVNQDDDGGDDDACCDGCHKGGSCEATESFELRI